TGPVAGVDTGPVADGRAAGSTRGCVHPCVGPVALPSRARPVEDSGLSDVSDLSVVLRGLAARAGTATLRRLSAGTLRRFAPALAAAGTTLATVRRSPSPAAAHLVRRVEVDRHLDRRGVPAAHGS